MGDFALDAIHSSMDCEFYRDENRDKSSREPHSLFDSGCFDYESLTKDIAVLHTMLDNPNMQIVKEMPPFQDDKEYFSFTKNVADRLTKYERKFQMMLGMATQVQRGKPLSEKQRNWIDTNWKGGWIVFERDFDQSNRKGRDGVTALNRILFHCNNAKKGYAICKQNMTKIVETN
jgi:hypothetical protein